MSKRVVMVTGANSGIGFHLSKCLLEKGFRVAGLDVDQENFPVLEENRSDCWRGCRCDVTRVPQVELAVRRVIEAWGRIDVLVNNACLASFASFQESEIELHRRVFEVNYFGYLNVIRAVFPQMKAQGVGIIHNVSSGVGLTGFPGLSAYAASKGAIEALSRTLAHELEPYGIKVNLMHPPLTRTPSSAPLGIPSQMMQDPERVGHRLAQRILSERGTITPDVPTALGLLAMRHFPGLVGRMMARQARKARAEKV